MIITKCVHLSRKVFRAQNCELTVLRYELPSISALNYMLKDALGGGVTRSLALDAHGKGFSSALLDLDLPARDVRA